MKLTTAEGAVSGAFVDKNPSTGTRGTDITAEDLNNHQFEIAHPIIGAGFALDGNDDYQLERSIIAFRKRIGEFDFQGAEITPVTIAGSRSKANPSNPEYYPCIPRYDANHNVSATEVGQDVVNAFRAIKAKFKGVSDFTVSVSGTTVTFPSTPAAQALLQAIQNLAMVLGWQNGGQPNSFAADYATAATRICLTLGGTEYEVAAVAPGSYTATLYTAPSAGSYTASLFPHRIMGSTTSFRLRRLSGFVPATAQDDDGQYAAGMLCMDRLLPHWHIGQWSGSAGGESGLYSGTTGTRASSGSNNVAKDPVSDGVNTLRTGKTTDPRAFATFVGTWVRNLLATSYTSY